MIERSSQNGNYADDDYSAVSGTKSSQIAYGDYSAVAGPYGTAIVNVYRQAQPRQIAPDEIEKAKKLLDSMPLDVIADVADLPTGSRMPFDTNPLFVGRKGDIERIFNNIAMVLVPLEKYQLARKYYGRALQIQKQKKHGDRLLTAKILTNYGVLLRILGKLKRAQEHFEQALKIRQEMLGLDHRDTAHTLNNLGLLFRERGDFDLAQRYIEKALATVKKLFSGKHPDIALIYNDFGSLLHIKGKLTGARKYLVNALRMREQTVPEHHPHVAETFTNLGKVNLALGDKTKAAKCFERALPIYLLRFGNSHSLTHDVYAQLASMEEGSPMNGDRKENNRFKPVTG